MEKIGSSAQAGLLSRQVTASRYFFADLAPTARARLAVALGGQETCAPDYVIKRRSFPYHVLEIIAEGTGWVELEGVRHELRPGVVFVTGPSTRCEIHTDPVRPLVKYFVCVGGREVVRRLARAGLTPGRLRSLPAHAEVQSVVEDLIREGRRSGPLAREIVERLFEVLLLKIEDTAGWSGAAGDPAQETFLRCKALIDAEAERLGSLREVARRAGLEASSICRLFRRFQGTSPYQYLLRRKMNLAAEFLVEHGGLVKEAAQRVGFADPYHFSRCFKAVHGVAPSELMRGPQAERR